MVYAFQYRRYRRSFVRPLRTAHGEWSVREGIVLRLSSPENRVGWGEIAPIEWFGSESLSEALAFCQSLPSKLHPDDIHAIPDHLPACQFGLGSAWENVSATVWPAPSAITTPATCRLLPTGAAALDGRSLNGVRDTTFKWKIGVNEVQDEMTVFQKLMQILPAGSRLRLDANGSLTEGEACRWLELCDRYGDDSMQQSTATVEFLEQPLAPSQLNRMLHLSGQFKTPIALDESVATLRHLRAVVQQGWRGIVVVKPAIAGFPSHLRQLCQTHPPDLVWSSVFETAIARQFIQTRLIPSLPQFQRATGMGTTHWFADPYGEFSQVEQLWSLL